MPNYLYGVQCSQNKRVFPEFTLNYFYGLFHTENVACLSKKKKNYRAVLVDVLEKRGGYIFHLRVVFYVMGLFLSLLPVTCMLRLVSCIQ